MKFKAGRVILLSQFFILFLFFLLTFFNEIWDLPHFLLGDVPTSVGQRAGEVFIELCIFVLVMSIEWLMLTNLLGKIKLLEGFLPICSNCKKIRKQEQWEEIEQYITKHSLAEFSHSICPDCAMKLYGDLWKERRTQES